MKRRTALIAAFACPVAFAQQSRPRLIAFLTLHTRENGQATIAGVAEQLASRGYRAGIDFVIESRFAGGHAEQLAPLARELVDLKPDLILATGGNATVEAVMKQTRSIPIVMHGSVAPAELGLVASLNHPGGNVTGTTYAQREIAGKCLEILNAAAPRARRIACVWNPDFPGMALYRKRADPVAQRLGVTVSDVLARTTADISAAAIDATRPDALYVAVDAVVALRHAMLADYARARRMPSLGTHTSFAQAGGLLGVSFEPQEMVAAVAECIERIWRGAKPAEIPVREPSRYVVTLNRKTAADIGFTPGRELMLTVNELIE